MNVAVQRLTLLASKQLWSCLIAAPMDSKRCPLHLLAECSGYCSSTTVGMLQVKRGAPAAPGRHDVLAQARAALQQTPEELMLEQLQQQIESGKQCGGLQEESLLHLKPSLAVDQPQASNSLTAALMVLRQDRGPGLQAPLPHLEHAAHRLHHGHPYSPQQLTAAQISQARQQQQLGLPLCLPGPSRLSVPRPAELSPVPEQLLPPRPFQSVACTPMGFTYTESGLLGMPAANSAGLLVSRVASPAHVDWAVSGCDEVLPEESGLADLFAGGRLRNGRIC